MIGRFDTSSKMEKDKSSCACPDNDLEQLNDVTCHQVIMVQQDDMIMLELDPQKAICNFPENDGDILVEVGLEDGGAIGTVEKMLENEESKKKEPAIGIEFETIEDAKRFYNAYAYNQGFGIKVSQMRRSNVTGNFSRISFACSMERKSNAKEATNTMGKSSTRKTNMGMKTGCKVHMAILCNGKK